MATSPNRFEQDGRTLRRNLVRPDHAGSNRLDTRLASRLLATVVLEVPDRRFLSQQQGLLEPIPSIVVPEDRLIRIGEPVGVHITLTREEICLQGRGIVRRHQRLPAHQYQSAITVELGGDEGDFAGITRRLATGEELSLLPRDRRFQVRLPARVHRAVSGDRGQPAVVRDLSRSGMRLEMQELPDLGEELRVRLRPAGAHPFEAMTRVERIGCEGVAVRLLHASPRASAALKALYARISVLASLALS